MRVANICTRDVIYVTSSTSIREAATLMRRHHVGSLVVADQPNGERVPVGILTDRDIVLAVVAKGVAADDVTVGDAMTRSIATCGENEDLFDALQTMRGRGVRRIPVVNEQGALAGMLTADDAIGAISSYLLELTRALTREQTLELERRV
jgi:CBS domain-containing protein